MGGGILPVAKHNGRIYLLFSRERKLLSNDKDKGKWSDFGGSREKNESQYQTAIREGIEESAGLLGNKSQLTQTIKNHLVGNIQDKKYSIWMIEVKYDKNLPNIFHKHFMDGVKHHTSLVTDKNGLYEKDKIAWFNVNYLHQKKHLFRPFYKKYIPQIIKIAKTLK